MSQRTTTSLTCAVVALAVASGCYESYRGTRFARDGGDDRPDIVVPPPSADSGPPLADGGVTDAAIPPTDAAFETDGAVPPIPGVDGGSDPCMDGEQVPAYAGPGCDDSTLGCLRGCDDTECTQGCLADDPECRRCINQSLAHCANERGCQDEWDEFACCREKNCTDVSLRTCASGPCSTQASKWNMCAQRRSSACGPEIDDCFF